MLKIGVLASGGGTNFQAIADKINSGYIKNANISLVISDKKDALVLERAKKLNIDTEIIERKAYGTREEYTQKIIEVLKSRNIDLVLMCGFNVILTSEIAIEYENRIMNIHPSLIPSFCGKGYYGMKVHREVLSKGVKLTGATVHFVNSGVDEGPIIIQKAVEVKNDDTPETLQERVSREAEWEIYPEAVKMFAENRLVIKDGVVKIDI